VSLFWKREQANVTRRQSLAATPVLSERVRAEATDGGGLVLHVRIPRGAGLLDRFRPRVDERRYELDEFGAAVVRRIDNRRKVSEIVEAFHHEFGLSRRESELGVVAFLKMLMKRGLIGIEIHG